MKNESGADRRLFHDWIYAVRTGRPPTRFQIGNYEYYESWPPEGRFERRLGFWHRVGESLEYRGRRILEYFESRRLMRLTDVRLGGELFAALTVEDYVQSARIRAEVARRAAAGDLKQDFTDRFLELVGEQRRRTL